MNLADKLVLVKVKHDVVTRFGSISVGASGSLVFTAACSCEKFTITNHVLHHSVRENSRSICKVTSSYLELN